jgi:hypothetical protein
MVGKEEKGVKGGCMHTKFEVALGTVQGSNDKVDNAEMKTLFVGVVESNPLLLVPVLVVDGHERNENGDNSESKSRGGIVIG